MKNPIIPGVLLFIALCFSSCESNPEQDKLPLSGPKSIQLTARNESIVVQWSKVASAQGVAPYYAVYYSTNPNPGSAIQWAYLEAPEMNLVTSTITGLKNYVTYYVWVKTFFPGLGESDFSPTEYTNPIPPPQKPGNITLKALEEMLELSWDSVTDAFTYKIFCIPGDSAEESPPDGTMVMEVPNRETKSGGVVFKLADDTRLVNTTAYTLWVQAVNTAGESPYTKTNGTPQSAVSVPAQPPEKPTLTVGNKKIFVTWNQVSGVPHYTISYGTSNNFSESVTRTDTVPADTPIVSTEITGLINGTSYYVWVQSSNSKGNSAPSEAATAAPVAKPAINYNNLQFELGRASADFIFAVDLPPSVWFFNGRPSTDRLTRFQEAAIGNLFCDGAAWYIRNNYPEEIFDFVFLNGSFVNNPLPKGSISIGTMMNAVTPDGRSDKACLITLKGDRLIELFNDVADVPHTGHGSSNTGWFIMVSAEARYTIQYYKPPELSEWTSPDEIIRGTSEPYYHGWIKEGTLKINGQPIDVNKEYRILTTDYLARGEWYTTFPLYGTNKKIFPIQMWKTVSEYIYDQSVITPKLDGRVKIEGGVPLPPPWEPGNLINNDPPLW
ncbi:fibronectin type III domain protein [Treponema primitia ZAS-2]|uniref:Fibronectin type III domain protein n=1 Tax=Treponema primitia (strain ATCC BAA-887 / DSM 12427 / ZAS-2) TaxID=545694 RepID=F5YH71_TREPZ|nr:fibronectin type III domain-containing protein [Treponema primitia]AEF86457.1 fibronectin type III domain protein [Treponema primitia ZAS-2]